ncbi:MAG: hypothetical protein AAGU15_04640 [Anaerolineaceae bacterium]
MRRYFLICRLIIILLSAPLVLTGCGRWKKPNCSNKNKCIPVFTKNNPCHAQCWQGITPGITTLDDTLSILNTLPFIDSFTQVNENELIFESKIVIKDKQDAWLGFLYLIDEKVVYMSFAGELSFTFGDAEELLASPQKVLFYTHYLEGNVFEVYNFDRGVAYGTSDYYSSFVHKKNNLESDTPINTLILFDPALIAELTLENFFVFRKFQSGNFTDNLQEWKGYGNPLELYKQVEISVSD